MQNGKAIRLLLLEDLKKCYCKILNPLALQNLLSACYSTRLEKFKFNLSSSQLYEIYNLDLDDRNAEILVDCTKSTYKLLKNKDGLNIVDNDTLVPLIDSESLIKTEERKIVNVPFDKISAYVVFADENIIMENIEL